MNVYKLIIKEGVIPYDEYHQKFRVINDSLSIEDIHDFLIIDQFDDSILVGDHYEFLFNGYTMQVENNSIVYYINRENPYMPITFHDYLINLCEEIITKLNRDSKINNILD